MPETDHSSADVLRALLVSATSSAIFLPGDRDPRLSTFDGLVAVMDQALGGDEALYATHSFGDAFGDMNAPLRGSAYAATSTLFISAEVLDRQTIIAAVRPLRTISAVTVSSSTPDALYFFGHETWNRLHVAVALDGASITLPAARSTPENAAAFAAFYPSLIQALRN
ncbi:hypothetical protein [Clavibacter michiganensis]|uniref:hypothetical protein n=1 Tax=Clavibacter michiganensis TaxID=28447 RepID=UPI001BE05501|nr:hypothetical protein [Clavibacter michiganensis]MBT1636856.1 hypothetical protein [Clavibacter michiganensis]